MRVSLIVLLSVFFSHTSISQKIIKVSAKDSINLMIVWKQYVNAIETKNIAVLMQYSLPLVKCVYCDKADSTSTDNFMLIDRFINNLLLDLPGTPLWKEIKSNKLRISRIYYYNFFPKSVTWRSEGNVWIYNIRIAFLMPGRREPTTYVFRFAKHNESFELYELGT